MSDDELKRELEQVWAGMLQAFADYRLDDVGQLVVLEGRPMPPADGLKEAARHMPDLAGTAFLALRRTPRKPQLLGYLATRAAGPGRSTIVLVVFVRDGRSWKFAPGPASTAEVEVESASREALLKRADELPGLRL